MRPRLLLGIFLVCLLAGCASTGKKVQLPTTAVETYRFSPGERFLSYDFHKRKTTGKDGHVVDIRQNIIRRYEVLQADAQKGFWIRRTFGRIEQSRFVDSVLLGNAIAEADKGVVHFKGEPGIDEPSLLDRIGKVDYLRLDRFGRSIADGFSDPLPQDPLNLSDWSVVPGFQAAENVLLQPFAHVASDQVLSAELEWKTDEWLRLDHSPSKVQMRLSHRVGGVGPSFVQVVAFGDPTGQTEGAPVHVTLGRYFQQTVFDTTEGFVQNVKVEWEIQYTTQSGEKFSETYLFTSNNTKARRKTE